MAKDKLRFFSGTPVSEGVRLEVGKYTIFAVRNRERDVSVRMRREPRKLLFKLLRVPFLRGAVRLLRDIYRFLDGIAEGAELHPLRPVQGTSFERALARGLHVHAQSLVTLASAVLLPMLAFLFLYAAPKGAEAMMHDFLNVSPELLNLYVSLVRIAAMLFGVFIACRLRVLRRLLMYKGALNKVINCYELRMPMTKENADACSLCTRRSESAFLLSVTLLSLLIFPQLRDISPLLNLLARLAVLLIVAAVFNEPYRVLEVAGPTLAVRIMRAPIDLLQYISVLEPHPQMLEVAVCAMQCALDEDTSVPYDEKDEKDENDEVNRA